MSDSVEQAPEPLPHSWPARLFTQLALACDRGGFPIVTIALVMTVVSVIYTIRCLGFTTDRNEVLETPDRFHRNYLELRREFGVDDEIVVVVRGPRADENRLAIDALASTLRADREHFSSVLEKIDLEFVRHQLLLYLSLDVLQDLEGRLRTFKPLIRRVLQKPGLVPLFNEIDREMRAALATALSEVRRGRQPHVDPERNRDLGQALPILEKLVGGMTDCLTAGWTYRSLWMALLPPAPRPSEIPALEELPRAQYFSFQNGHTYLLMAIPRLDPSSSNPIGDRLARLEQMLAPLRAKYPEVEFGVTGKPTIENDEFVIAMADSEHATIVSVVGVVFLFLLTFRHLMRPALAMICLVMALSWTMGYTTLVIGRLNILTVTAMPMLVGLGIDFGIQVLCRYGEERGHGLDPLAAMVNTMAGTGSSILAAGITTSASFYAAWFTEFKGFQQLALLSGTGLIFCLVSMMTVYPALILMVEKSEMRRGRASSAHRAAPLTAMSALDAPLLRHPGIVVLLGAVFMIAATAAAVRLPFDANALRLQARGSSAVDWERRVYQASGHGLLYAAVVADDLPQARELQKRLERLPTVATVTSPVILVPDDQDRKIPVIERIHALMEDIPALHPPVAPMDVAMLRSDLEDLRALFLVIFQEARKAGGSEVADPIRSFVFGLDAFLQHLMSVEPRDADVRLAAYQDAVFRDLADKLDLLRGHGPVRKVRIADIPPSIRSYMLSASGRALLRVFPREDVWDQEPMERFLSSIEMVYPREKLTGTAMQVYMAAIAIRRSCQKAMVCALIVIVLTLLLHFRSIFLTILGMVPLGLGLVWTGGIMYAFGIDLNPANYMALPLILGIGVANGVYVVRRAREEGTPALFSVSTGRAIVLSNLTAMLGFGSLLVARHAGMRSLGLVMSIGIGMCAVAALTVLSALLQLLLARHWVRDRER